MVPNNNRVVRLLLLWRLLLWRALVLAIRRYAQTYEVLDIGDDHRP